MALNKDKALSDDFAKPVWELWDWDEEEKKSYTDEITEPMDLQTLGKQVQQGETMCMCLVIPLSWGEVGHVQSGMLPGLVTQDSALKRRACRCGFCTRPT